MFRIVKDMTEGHGSLEDIDLLVDLAGAVKLSSLCGLGQTAPNPVLSSIRYFRNEYEAHVREKTCPAGVCAGLETQSTESLQRHQKRVAPQIAIE
jgi:NADH-quinone oxidoreductase subunit F/NADP-reducing hydrogenase subunit HndC